ncbi:hypothetical protein H2198_005014 [Neophaeococcomyces mojaviensis]|uniref:Uncharacterized protein n=1 Tax=Neophaeococcomyces mojaviensis TaxID=3383035 RepID=A0ACC3A7A6_9EURO|nr:hypothetical protein H2198_005014 [Knufia sp. JES_112]
MSYYVTGVGELADVIANDADSSLALYKRFDKLGARDLLYYQSELSELLAEQETYDREDANQYRIIGGPYKDIKLNSQDWPTLRESATQDARWKARMELAVTIRKTLKDYSELDQLLSHP